MLTDYQEAKKKSRLTLQITDWKYLKKSEIADSKLCRLAFKHRDWLLADDEQRLQRLFRFLAYVNQSDWRATQLLKLVEELDNEDRLKEVISFGIKEFERQNKKREKTGVLLLPDTDRRALEKIQQVQPLYIGVLEAAENWVVEVLKDAARAPSGAEWHRLKTGALDGKIGMSFALQWRYNFANIFRGISDLEAEIEIPGQLDLDQADCE